MAEASGDEVIQSSLAIAQDLRSERELRGGFVYTILGIGELLWDMLPEGPQLGGAPANYTVMAGRLGNHATIISRIGRDALGERALGALLGTQGAR